MSTSSTMPPSLTLIVAATTSNGIGIASSLPWRLSKEMTYFAKVTREASEKGKENVVVMGRKTWEGIPKKFRPLEGRINVVVSRNEAFDLGNAPNTHLANSLSSASSLLSTLSYSKAFLIGGSQLYAQSLPLPTTTRVLLTRVLSPSFDQCDAFFPPLKEEDGWEKASHKELEEFVGFEVEEGEVKEVDRLEKDVEKRKEVTYRFEMWVR